MRREIRFILLLMVYAHSLMCAPLLDLDEYIQDFVRETKQIHIPGFPGAFNAAVVRWREKILMCFRVRDGNGKSTFQIGCVWLDDDFNPISQPVLLEILGDRSTFDQRQDPRLIEVGGRLYIIYSNFITIDDIATRRMFLAELKMHNERFYIENPLCIHPFAGASKRWEKNWVPFTYRSLLLLSYSLNPHLIFKPSLTNGACRTISSTYTDIVWPWGELRGGTPALLDGDRYIAFFHSSKDFASTHSHGKKITHYVMGAYTFTARPPFAITHISAHPIVAKTFYHVPEYPTWKPLRVVFPMGCIADENYFWVTYGRQDFEIWVAKIDKKGLYASLHACQRIDKQEFEHSKIVDTQLIQAINDERQDHS